MILESLAIRNWRGYRTPHRFTFCETFNLVVGPNEAGKSTLFEALTRALFDRHTSRAEEISSARPLDSSLSPEVSVTFQSGGRRFKAEKRFLSSPYSRLYSQRGTEWELDHEGDAADAQLRNILSGESPNRSVKPEHRGLAEALWYLQGEDPVPRRTWNQAIKTGLSGVLQLASSSPVEQKMAALVSREFGQYFTATGRIRAGTELQQLEANLQEQEQRFKELQDRQQALEELRQELDRLEQTLSQKEGDLVAAKAELTASRKRLGSAEEFESTFRKTEDEARTAREHASRISNSLATYQSNVSELRKLRDKLTDVERLVGESRSASSQHLKDAERQRAQWQNELEPQLKAVERDDDLLRAMERLRRLEKESERLGSHLKRIERLATEWASAQTALHDLNAPSATEWDEFQGSLLKLSEARGMAAASAIRVRFDLLDSSIKIDSSPAVQPVEGAAEYMVTEPTSFAMEGIGHVQVRGGGSSLLEIQSELTKLEDQVATVLARYQVNGTAELAALRQHRVTQEDSFEELSTRLDEAKSDEPDATEELRRVESGISQERIRSQGVDKKWVDAGGTSIREEIDRLRDEKDSLIAQIKRAQANEQSDREHHVRTLSAGQSATNEQAALSAKIGSIEELNASILDQYGSLDALTKQAAKTKTDVGTLEEQLARMQEQYEENVSLPRRLIDQQETQLEALADEANTLRGSVIDRQARIEQAAAQGLYSEMGDLDALVQFNRERLAVLQARGEATMLISDLVDVHHKAQASVVADPIERKLRRWIEILTDGRYKGLKIDEELFPQSLEATRYTDAMPVAHISFGTREQIVVLLRLALGVLMSEEERNLVVIDDSLVNADILRMNRLRLILQEVAESSCQIIVATCNSTPYAGMPGTVIHVPEDGILESADAQ